MNAVITEPGIYEMPEDVYHADPVPGGSLSCSGAKKLLPPSCPARFAYEREHPPPPKDVFEFGTAAHSLVLGKDKPLAWLEVDDWRSKSAQEWRHAVRGEGSVPLLKTEHDQVQAMAAAIRTHPLASALLCGGHVQAEQSMFWHDEDYGIWRRARLDTVRQPGASRAIVADYKTAASADPATFARAAANYGYHMQDAWYRDALAACLGDPEPAFLFVVQEKAPPYLVMVCELNLDDVAVGHERNRRAMEIYRDCTSSGVWPGYQPENEITLITLPPWARTPSPTLEIT